MIHRDDLWKVGMVLVAVAGAITSHALTLPAAWQPYEPYIEFSCGVIAVVTSVLIRPDAKGSGK